MRKSLSHKAIKGGVWVFSIRIVQQVFDFTKLFILARALTPSDFGLIGISLLVISILMTFSETGFQAALIQQKKQIESYLDVAWTLLIFRGIFLFFILYFIAPYAALYFEVQNATNIIRIISISILLQSFTNIGVVCFQKNLEFNKQFIYHLSGVLVEFIVSVSTVFIVKNVWALIIGLLSGNAVRCIVSYLITSYRPRFSFNLVKAKELFSFGKWVFGSSVLVFLNTQGDDILVAKIIGVTALGFYQVAYRISNIPATEISHVISQVAFPTYSKLQDNISKLKECYLNVLQFTVFISSIVTSLIFEMSSDFINLFLGDKWMPAVPVIKVLAVAGLFRSIAATSGYLLYAVAKPKVDTQMQFLRLIVLVILIYPLAVNFGIIGVSIVVLLSIFISNIGFSFYAIKVIKCKASIHFKLIIIPLLNGAIVVLFLRLIRPFFYHNIFNIIILSVLGCLVYAFLASICDKLFGYGIKYLIVNNFRRI